MFDTTLNLSTILMLEAAVFFSLLSVYMSSELVIIPMVEAGKAPTGSTGSYDSDDIRNTSSSNIGEKCFKDKNLLIAQQNESGSNIIGDIRVNNEEGTCLEINSDDANIKTDNNLQQTTNDVNNDQHNEQNCVGKDSSCSNTAINQQSESGNNEIGDINLN
jgi:hypothetical protein